MKKSWTERAHAGLPPRLFYRLFEEKYGITFVRRSTAGAGVTFVDVLDSGEFRNTNFKVSYICAKFSALHFSRKILTD